MELGITSIVFLIITGLQVVMFIVYKAHSRDTQAHKDVFESLSNEIDFLREDVSKDIRDVKKGIADSVTYSRELITNHSIDSTAHGRAAERINTLEQDMRYVREGIQEIKDMVNKLLIKDQQ